MKNIYEAPKAMILSLVADDILRLSLSWFDDAFEDKVLNATAFTDHHVGKMIDRWRNTPAWDNMLVVLIADHGISYPEGTQIGSVPRQRIPMVWTGGAVREPMQINTYAAQCDLSATLLAQLGIDHSDFIFSKDIFAADTPPYAYWSFNNGFGIIADEGNVVYDCTGDKIVSSECTDPAAEQRLIGSINNGIHLHFRYIVSYYFKRHRCTSFVFSSTLY